MATPRDPRDVSPFRHPPVFSRATPIGLVALTARTFGLGGQVLRLLARKLMDAERYRAIFARYPVGPEDVFVSVFSKSGTNWAMQMVVQLAWEGRGEFAHIHEVVPWPGAPFSGIASLGDDGWRAAPHPRHAIKTNAPLRVLPLDSPARFLTVLRDPKEVVVSAFHFLRGVFGLQEEISAETFLAFALNGPFLAGWADSAACAWAERERPNVLVLRFDELKADLPGSLERVASFLDVPLSDETRAVVVERCGFAWMKEHEYQFGPPLLPFRGDRPTAQMLRRGVTGDPGELLSPEIQARIDDAARAALAELGSDLPYAEWFTTDA